MPTKIKIDNITENGVSVVITKTAIDDDGVEHVIGKTRRGIGVADFATDDDYQAAVQAELDKVIGNNDKKAAKIEAQRSRIDDLKTKRDQLKTQRDEARAERDTAKSERDQAIADLAAMTAERDTLAAQIAEGQP